MKPKRYVLRGHGKKGWPEEIPLVEGQHFADFDVDESRMPPEWVEARRREARKNAEKHASLFGKTISPEVDDRPMGVWANKIPEGASIEAVES